MQRRPYEMLVRVRDFGTIYRGLFPESSRASKAFAAVASAVQAIETSDVTETSASVSARATRKQAARRALYERLVLVAKTAQVLPVEPGFKAHFTIPSSRNDQGLLTTARQCVQRSATEAAQFVEHGMPANFPDDLTALIEAFEKAVRDRGMSRDQLVAAKAGIQEALANGFTAVGQLEVIVANHLAANA